MDSFIQQLQKTIKTQYSISSEEATARAIKEVVLSGMSRCGALKTCPWIPGLESFENNTLSLCFLYQGDPEEFSRELYFPYVKIETAAAGISDEPRSEEFGFSVSYDGIKVFVYIYQKNFDLKPVFSYQQQPLPYEMISINEMLEGVRSEIEKFMNNEPAQAAPEKKKKTVKKTEAKKKETKKTEENLLQPSLFDF